MLFIRASLLTMLIYAHFFCDDVELLSTAFLRGLEQAEIKTI